MARYRLQIVLGLFFLTSIPSFAHHLAVVVNKDANVNAMTSADLGKVLKCEKRWPSGHEAQVVLSKNSAMTLQVLQRLLGLSAADTKAFIAAHKNIVWAESDDELIRIVAGTPGALGLVDVHSISNGVTVLKIDGKLPHEQGYLPH